jgi:hypothetical protein
LSHILFDGDIRRHPALRSLFWQWGVTVGRLPSEPRDGSRVTVEECDAVVHLCGVENSSAHDFGAMPDGAEEEGVAAAEAAPLLVIGSGQAPGQAWIVISDPGPGGSRLKAALQSCEERSRFLRGDPVSRQDRDRFRDFLGHELRTPLTAIQTALAILQSDPNLADGPDRMLGIARRNLARLADTVEWSQELRSLAEATPAPELDTVSPEDLARLIPGHLNLEFDPIEESRGVFTDPRLLGTLVGQMERVLSFACPGCLPEFNLDFDPESGGGILTAGVSRYDGRSSAPEVARTGAGTPGHNQDDWSKAEFRNLARLMISPHLQQVLGVRVRVSSATADMFQLSLDLPAVQAVDACEPSAAV